MKKEPVKIQVNVTFDEGESIKAIRAQPVAGGVWIHARNVLAVLERVLVEIAKAQEAKK